uniref:Uncharacterized protein n=1 Tax=Ditylenchus dipsaci TaxID=166011 RepID=A0A915EQE3_9BILA
MGRKGEQETNENIMTFFPAIEKQDRERGKLQKSEIPHNVYIYAEPWTPVSGLLTEALKLKRKNIEKALRRRSRLCMPEYISI